MAIVRTITERPLLWSSELGGLDPTTADFPMSGEVEESSESSFLMNGFGFSIGHTCYKDVDKDFEEKMKGGFSRYTMEKGGSVYRYLGDYKVEKDGEIMEDYTEDNVATNFAHSIENLTIISPQRDLIGVPIPIIKRMLIRQFESRGRMSLEIMDGGIKESSNFVWGDTPEDHPFWAKVMNKDYDTYFEKYPEELEG